jgi:hypothetical protein
MAFIVCIAKISASSHTYIFPLHCHLVAFTFRDNFTVILVHLYRQQSCPCARHEGIWVIGGIAPHILMLNTRYIFTR